MKKNRDVALVMIIAMLGIAGFQLYWLKNNYETEDQSLQLITQAAFRQTILSLQAKKFRLEQVLAVPDTSISQVTVHNSKHENIPLAKKIIPAISVLNVIQEKMKDSLLHGSSGKLQINFDGDDTVNRRRIEMSAYTNDNDTGKIKHWEMRRSVSVSNSIMLDSFANRVIILGNDSMMPLMNSSKASNVTAGTSRLLRPAVKDSFKNKSIIRYLYRIDSLSFRDSVTTQEIEKSLTCKLHDEGVQIDLNVRKIAGAPPESPDVVTVGFVNPVSYQLTLQQPWLYVLKKLQWPIIFSLLLVSISMLAFLLLYKAMLRQQRLTAHKNDFISNITHELKTPIATVSVAIEALQNFNVLNDKQRTGEYLAISKNELHRLNLLVDKVLRLSMFEERKMSIDLVQVDLGTVLNEVVSSMQLLIEKNGARVSTEISGDCIMQVDRQHMASVFYNLLDNALKYSKVEPRIEIHIEGDEKQVMIKFSDNGLGIPGEYLNKLGEKFFRIPHGDVHNAKGYGLGLSYVKKVVKDHNGTFHIESREGEGSVFTILLPKNIS